MTMKARNGSNGWMKRSLLLMMTVALLFVNFGAVAASAGASASNFGLGKNVEVIGIAAGSDEKGATKTLALYANKSKAQNAGMYARGIRVAAIDSGSGKIVKSAELFTTGLYMPQMSVLSMPPSAQGIYLLISGQTGWPDGKNCWALMRLYNGSWSNLFGKNSWGQDGLGVSGYLRGYTTAQMDVSDAGVYARIRLNQNDQKIGVSKGYFNKNGRLLKASNDVFITDGFDSLVPVFSDDETYLLGTQRIALFQKGNTVATLQTTFRFNKKGNGLVIDEVNAMANGTYLAMQSYD